ncbi:hypothetical protein C8A01DRAFT_37583 [Parachaetomium inaequale]|uniref:Uncharacterized protein n=1 Tax=Parachaetomium inaequale TaxID=2588326 RepID=A0AAN6PEB3_9PEZI|nr:hypothetical protein C8A01DRAFT_37583 [Parachaetomium inaequale]
MANASNDMERAAPGPRPDNMERVQLLLAGDQSSTEKAQTLIGLLEEGYFQAHASQRDSDDDETEDDDNEIDYMEGDGDASPQNRDSPPQDMETPTKGEKPTSSASSPVDQSDDESFEYQVPDEVLLAGTSGPFRAGRTSVKFSAPASPEVGRARASALRLTRRLVRYLETTGGGEEQHSDADLRDLAFGDFHEGTRARSIQAAAQQADGSESLESQQFQPGKFFVATDSHIPPPTAAPSGNIRTAVRNTTASAKPTSEFEILLRAKIFKPAITLSTSIPEPSWTDSNPDTHCLLFSKPPGIPLSPRSLLPLGQFVAEREKNISEALKEIELGVGVSASGFGVDVSATGLLQLLKPYQWITTWRSLSREVHVGRHLLEAAEFAESGDSEDSKMERLHKIENELMSSVKYQFGESEYITVITYSNDVDSGAVALFKASSFGKNSTVTRLDLEARFQDMPKEICRILVKEGNPNRFELKRAGKTLTCRARGVLPPLRPAIVAAEEGKEEWTDIGGGWRRALHIILNDDHDGDSELELSTPREGLIATVPQMLALLHLRYRLVDAVPSAPIFSFAPPLRCGKAGAADPSGYVRRGIKLLGPPSGAPHVGNAGTIAVLFSRESRWVREQLFWA